MTPQLPTRDANLEALRRLLSERREDNAEAAWEESLSQLGVRLPPVKEKKKPKTSADAANAGEEGSVFVTVAMTVGVKFVFMMMKKDPELKDEILVLLSSLLSELPALSLQSVTKDQSAALDELEQHLLGSLFEAGPNLDLSQNIFSTAASSLVPKEDQSGSRIICELFSLLAKSRGSLRTNLLLARILVSQPALLSQAVVKELRQMATVSHAWLRPAPGSVEEMILAWKEAIFPMVKTKFPDVKAHTPKWEQVEALLKEGKVAEAQESVEKMLQSGEQAREDGAAAAEGEGNAAPPSQHIDFPTAESIAASRPTSGDGNSTEGELEALERRLAQGSAADATDAAMAVMAVLAQLADRLVLPSSLKQGLYRLPGCLGPPALLAAVCDILGAIPQDLRSSSSAAAAVAPADSRRYAVLVQGALAVVRVNLQWMVKEGGLAPGSVKAATAEVKQAMAAVEGLLRNVQLGAGAHAGCAHMAGEHGRQLAADGYAMGIDTFFSNPAAILAVVGPLLQQQAGSDSASEQAGATDGARLFCAAVVGRISQLDMLPTLLSAAQGSEDATLLAALVESMAEYALQAAQRCAVRGQAPAAVFPPLPQARRQAGEEWFWKTFNPQAMRSAEDGRRIIKTGGPDYSVALGSVGFSDGQHTWELEIGPCESQWLGVAPKTVNVDREWSLGMVGYGNGGQLRTQAGDQVNSGHSHDRYRQGDIITVELDLDTPEGTITFLKAGQIMAKHSPVRTEGVVEVFPFVQFDYNESVTIKSQESVYDDQSTPMREHLAVACGHFTATVLAWLDSELVKGPSSEAQTSFADVILSGVLRKTKAFFTDCSQGQLKDMSLGHLMGMLEPLAGFTATKQHRSLFSFVPAAATLTRSLFKKSAIPDAPPLSLLIELIMEIDKLLSARPQLNAFTGSFHRGFLLAGMPVEPLAQARSDNDKAARLVSVELEAPLGPSWTVEYLMKQDGEDGTQIFGAPDMFALKSPGKDTLCLNVDDTSLPFTGVLPLGAWASVCLVGSENTTSLFIDGVPGGSVDKALSGMQKFTLCEPPLSQRHRRARLFRVWDRALSAEEIAGLYTGGTAPAEALATVDLFGTARTKEVPEVQRVEGRGECSIAFGRNAAGGMPWREPHWVSAVQSAFSGLAASGAVQVVRGQRRSEAEEKCVRWLREPPLSGGLGPAVLDEEALAMAAEGGSGMLEELLQAKVAIRPSQLCDRMEKTIILAGLHHCGVLGQCKAQARAQWSAALQATANNASLTARSLRKHVATQRDLANQRLREDEDSRGWEDFCLPVIAKAELLLRVPPMCSVIVSEQAKTALAAEAFMDAGQRRATAAAEKWAGKAKDELRTQRIYKQMWAQANLGRSREKKVLESMQGLLKDEDASSEQLEALAAREEQLAGAMLESLAMLRALLHTPSIRHQSLQALASSAGSGDSILGASTQDSTPAKAALQEGRQALNAALVSVLEDRAASMAVRLQAVSALVVRMDRADLAHLLNGPALAALKTLLQPRSSVWESQRRVVTERVLCDATCSASHAGDGPCANCGEGWGTHHSGHNCPNGLGRGRWIVSEKTSVRDECPAADSVLRLPVCLLLQAGVHAGHMEDTEVQCVVDFALQLVSSLVESDGINGGKSQTLNVLALQDEQPPWLLQLRKFECGLSRQCRVKGFVYRDGDTEQGRMEVTGRAINSQITAVASAGDETIPFEVKTERDGAMSVTVARLGVERKSFPAYACYDDGDAGCRFASSTQVLVRQGFITTIGSEKGEATVSDPITPESNYVQVNLLLIPKTCLSLGVEGLYAFQWDENKVCSAGKGPEKPGPFSIAVGEVLGCRVVFEGSAATKIEWIVGGSVVKSATLSEKERGVPMKFVIKVSVPNPGGTSQVIQVTTEPRREALTFKAKEGVLQLLKAMGASAHSAVLRRMLAVSHRRQALWLALRSDKLPTESRQAALQVLAAALLEPKALEESELSACIEELLDFVIDLSPEGGSKLLGDDMLPCLDLRRGVVQVLRQLREASHTETAVSKELLQRLCDTSQPRRALSAVLAVGGALDQLVFLNSKGGSSLREEVRDGILDLADRVCAEASGQTSGADMMLRARVTKVLWEFSTCAGVSDAIGARSSLVASLISTAQQRSRVPIKIGAGSGTLPMLFQGSMIESGGWIASCERGDCCYMNRELKPGTGKHYVEVEPGKRTDSVAYFGFIDAAKSRSSDLATGWCLASDGDVLVGGTERGRHHGWPQSFTWLPNSRLGLLVDTDAREASWYRDGKHLTTVVGQAKWPEDSIIVGVKTGQWRVVPAAEVSWKEGVQCMSRSSSRDGDANGPWVTMEMLAAKTHSLSSEIGALFASSQQRASGPVSAIPAPQDVSTERVLQNITGGDTAGSSIMQAIQTPKAGTSEPEVLALAPAPPQEGKGTDIPHSQWPTLIDDDPEKAKVKLLAETEDALAISFARLALLQLLAAGTKPVARVLDPPAFLSAIAPFFPRASSEHRPVFSASHLDSVVPLLHEATTRWLEVRRQENLRGNVPAMSTASLAAMRRDIAASCLLASGVTRIFGVMPGSKPVAPSVVTWIGPPSTAVRPSFPESEMEIGVEHSAALGQWLAAFLLHQPEDGSGAMVADVDGLVECLLQSLVLCNTPDTRRRLQEWLASVLSQRSLHPAKEWSKGVSDVLGVLRGQMLWQLEQELTTPRPDALLHSSNLQSLCAITIAGEAMLHKNSLPKIVGDLQQALEKDEKPQPEQEEAAVPEVKVGNEVMAALLSFGYNERVIELVAQLHPMPSTFATPEGEQVLDNLMASNLLTLEVQELEERVAQKRKLPGANAGSKEDEKELEGSKSVAMEKLQGLAALTQVLKAVHLKQPLPPAFVDHCKTEILPDSVLKTWDDTDFSSGVLVSVDCKEAYRIPSAAGVWGAALGNYSLHAHPSSSAFIVIEPRPDAERSELGKAQVGVIMLEGAMPISTREQLSGTGLAPASVSMTVGAVGANKITVCPLSGPAFEAPSSAGTEERWVKKSVLLERPADAKEIGVILSLQAGRVVVAGCKPDSPAARSGQINQGDRLLAVDGSEFGGRIGGDQGTSQSTVVDIVKLLDGPPGSFVRLDFEAQVGDILQPGDTVSIRLDATGMFVEFAVRPQNTDVFKPVGRAELPASGLPVVPFVSFPDSALTAKLELESPSQEGQGRVPQKLLVCSPMRSFPGKNTATLAQLDWERAFDSEWPRVCDELIVDFAIQHMETNKADNSAGSDVSKAASLYELDGKALFPDAADDKDDAASQTLERQSSRLPPTVRSISSLSLGFETRVSSSSSRENSAWSLPGRLPSSSSSLISGSFKAGPAKNEAPNLSSFQPAVLRARWGMIKVLNKTVETALDLVDIRKFDVEGSIGHLLCLHKGLIFPTIKDPLFVKSIQLTGQRADPPGIVLNRGTLPPERRKMERTLVHQLMEIVDNKKIPLTVVGGPGAGNQAWITRLEGEGGVDHGGLYRESLREICAELQAQEGLLKILLPCPNQRMAMGSCQDKWLPNPLLSSSVHMRMLRFIGKLLGVSLRTEACIELDFPSLVWKQFVGEECGREDVAAVDEPWSRALDATLGVHHAQDWTAKTRTWTVKSCTGQAVDLIPGGSTKVVAWEEKDDYVEAQIRWRVKECKTQTAAIVQGFKSVIPDLALPLLTWRQLERKVCGTPVIDVDRLESTTAYSNCDKNHEVIQRFWKVVREFKQEELSALLGFAWGRKRMPVPHSGDHLKIKLLDRDNSYLPEAHTCFFAIDLPQYTTDKAMREKLKYAIFGCAAIDNDNGHPAGVLHDDEGAEAEEEAIENLDAVARLEAGMNADSEESQRLVIPLDHGDARVQRSGAQAVLPPWTSRPRVVPFRGHPEGLVFRPDDRTVRFGVFGTARYEAGCPSGFKAYYELKVIEELRYPQCGFGSSRFMPCLSGTDSGVGDDEHSWGVDGQRRRLWNGTRSYGGQWSVGDVIGFACDNQTRQILVSVNGNWEAPHGLVFDQELTRSGSPPDMLYAAFTASRGSFEYNMGDVPFAFAPPSADYLPFARLPWPMGRRGAGGG